LGFVREFGSKCGYRGIREAILPELAEPADRRTSMHILAGVAAMPIAGGGEDQMAGFGVLLIILGIGSLLLPMFDIQFRIMSLLDDYQPIAGVLIAAIGVALVILGRRRTTTQVVIPAAAPPSTQVPPSEPPAA